MTAAAGVSGPASGMRSSIALPLRWCCSRPKKFFLDAARTSGLTVPPNELATDTDGSAGLLIQRFDRITVDGALTLLAVEDGCQVQGRPPADGPPRDQMTSRLRQRWPYSARDAGRATEVTLTHTKRRENYVRQRHLGAQPHAHSAGCGHTILVGCGPGPV